MEKVTIRTTVKAPIQKVWEQINNPKDIEQWNHASDDWHCLNAANDLQVGGALKSTMAAKDGSFSFDFEGIYDEIIPHKLISYRLGDGRRVAVYFEENGQEVYITEIFDAEDQNPIEMQKQGWQAILENFKKYVEHS